jgi:hypothetical protein
MLLAMWRSLLPRNFDRPSGDGDLHRAMSISLLLYIVVGQYLFGYKLGVVPGDGVV